MEKIIYTNGGGVCVITPTEEALKGMLLRVDEKGRKCFKNRQACVKAIADKDVPTGSAYRVVGSSDIPGDRLFRGAWVDDGTAIKADLPRAKGIAHGLRRVKRAEAFAPHDEVIARAIPGSDITGAENERQAIRGTDAAVQIAIDGAKSESALRAALAT